MLLKLAPAAKSKPTSKSATGKPKFVLLDDSGKLFGKYDLFIPLFILVVLALVIMVARVLLQKDEYVTVELFASGGEWWWNNPSPPYWLVDPIKKGAVERDPQGDVLVEVLETRKFEAADRKLLWMKVKLKVSPDKKSNQFRFRREMLQVGSVIYVSPGNVKIVCNVLRIEGMEDNRKEVTKLVTIRSLNVLPWYTDNIKIGDAMYDSDGKVVAEVVKKTVTLANMTTVDDRGQTHASKDPLYRDVDITMRLKLTQSEGLDYFSYFLPLKKNYFIAIPLEVMNVEGTIIDFSDDITPSVTPTPAGSR